MDSRETEKLDFDDYLLNGQDAFYFPGQAEPQPSDINNVRNQALEQLQHNTSETQMPGAGHILQSGRQSSKRLRSNSDEASDSSLSQLLASLAKASPDDIRKISNFLNGDLKDLSPNEPSSSKHTSGAQINDAGLVPMQDPLLNEQSESSNSSSLAQLSWDESLTWMQPISSTPNDSDEQYVTPFFDISTFLNYNSRESMPIQGTPHHNPVPRSHVSQPLPLRGVTAPSAAAFMLREGLVTNPHNLNRDSGLSASSYDTFDSCYTDMRADTNRSSATSITTRSSVASRKLPPQRTMSSSISSKRIQHPVSALEGDGNAALGARVPCSYPTCGTTFGRDADRIRHESSIHKTDGGYLCLLHTCSSSCPAKCMNKQHKSAPYRNARPDKMKDHLCRAHNWTLKQKEIPKAFSKSFERGPRGWTCGCGSFLGNWHDDEVDISAHAELCTGELQVNFKRLSVDDPLVRLSTGSLTIDKALPPTPLNIRRDKGEQL